MAPRDRQSVNFNGQPKKRPLFLFSPCSLGSSLQALASAEHDTLSRRTMRPFAPIRSSVWLRGPKVGSIVGTEWLETIPTASGPNLTLRRKGPGNELHSASTELRSPLCIGRARPMHTDDCYHPGNRCCRQRASTVDVDPTSWGHAGHRRRRLWMDSQSCSSVGERREVDRCAYRSIESTQWTSLHTL